MQRSWLIRSLKKEQYGIQDIIVVLSNAFIFYLLGFLLVEYETTHNYAGLFTIINATVHLAVSRGHKAAAAGRQKTLLPAAGAGDRILYHCRTGSVRW